MMKPIPHFRLKTLVIASAVSLLVACGGDIGTITVPDIPDKPAGQFVSGALDVLRDVGKSEITVTDVKGNRLNRAPIVADANGVFRINLDIEPPYRVVVTNTNSGIPEAFSAYVQKDDKHIAVNAVTTLVDRYLLKHPGLSLAQAEDKVRAYLRIPAFIALNGAVHYSDKSDFSHNAFMNRARSYAGGTNAFIADMLNEIDGQKVAYKAARAEALTAEASPAGSLADSLGGDVLFPPIPLPDVVPTDTMIAAQENNNAYDDSQREMNKRMADLSKELIKTTAEVAGKALGAEALGPVGTLIGDQLVDGVLQLFGISTDPNAPVLEALKSVAKQINQVQLALGNMQAYLVQAFAQTNYLVQANMLNAGIGDIPVYWGGTTANAAGYADGVQGMASANLSGPGLEASASLLQGFFTSSPQKVITLDRELTAIQTQQLGTSTATGSLITAFRATQPAADNVRSNYTTEPMRLQYNRYATQQLHAATMMAALHRSQMPPNHADALRVMRTSAAQMAKQRAMIPMAYPDNNVIVDVVHDRLYYRKIQSETQYSMAEAAHYADRFRDAGGISYWQLATSKDLDDIIAASGATPPFKNVLNKLGFETPKGQWHFHGTCDIVFTTMSDCTKEMDMAEDMVGVVGTYKEVFDANGGPNMVAVWSKGFLSDGAIKENPVPVIGRPDVTHARYVLVKDLRSFGRSLPDGITRDAVIALSDTLGTPTVNSDKSQLGVQATLALADYWSDSPPDATTYGYWKSDNPAIADVSNVAGEEGKIVRAAGSPGGTVNFSFTMWATRWKSPKTKTVAVNFDAVPSELPVKSMAIVPQFNLNLTQLPPADNPYAAPHWYVTDAALPLRNKTPFYALVQYSNDQVLTADSGVIWTANVPGASFQNEGSQKYLILPDNLPAGVNTVTVTAAYKGVSVSTNLKINK